jgi:hypothetical protein
MDLYNEISGAGVVARRQIERSLDEEHRAYARWIFQTA